MVVEADDEEIEIARRTLAAAQADEGRAKESLKLTSDSVDKGIEEARAGVDRERQKMAGADVNVIPSLPPEHRAEVRDAIDRSFASAFRVSMFGVALLAIIAAIFGASIRHAVTPNDNT